jgi:hypothetical protein
VWLVAQEEREGSRERDEKDTVEDDDGGEFGYSADRVRYQWDGGDSDDSSEDEEEPCDAPVNRLVLASSYREPEREQEDEGQRRDDVCERQGLACGKGGVEVSVLADAAGCADDQERYDAPQRCSCGNEAEDVEDGTRPAGVFGVGCRRESPRGDRFELARMNPLMPR